MLVGVPAHEIIGRLHAVRKPKRAHKLTHRTNVGEIVRLLSEFGFSLGRRMRYDPCPLHGVYLLRVERGRGANWHWALAVNGTVYDPAKTTVSIVAAYPRLSWYAIEGSLVVKESR